MIDLNRKSGKDRNLIEIWNTIGYQDAFNVKLSSLYNFLCCLQQIDNISPLVQARLKMHIDNGATIEANQYGYVINSEFYLRFDVGKKEQKLIQNKMINHFYSLLNQKKKAVVRTLNSAKK